MTKAKKSDESVPNVPPTSPAKMHLEHGWGLGGTWLDQRLKALYEPVIHEPLPEEMLRLPEPRKH